MTTVWTIGHAHADLDNFRSALERFEIEVVIDVRSRPYVRFAHHFDWAQLAPST